MKKYILTLPLLAFLSAAFVFAEIDSPTSKRHVEFGLDIEAAVTENAISVGDIFTKELIIDLPKIYDGMGDEGFLLTLGLSPSTFANFSLGGFGIGYDIGVDTSISAGLSKDIFGLLAYGNELDKDIVSQINLQAQSFATVSVPVKFSLLGLTVKAVPTVFAPIFYVPQPSANVTVRSNSDGKISAVLGGGVDVYSAVNFESIMNGTLDIFGEVSSLDYGVDIGGSVEYSLFSNLDIGGYISFPFIPGHLKYKTSTTLNGSVEITSIADFVSGKEDSYSMNTDSLYTAPVTVEEKYAVNRPFRLGAQAAFRPFGNTFIVIKPRVGVAATNPFGDDFSRDSMYYEYSLAASASLLGIIQASVKTEYTDKIYAHSLGLVFNMHILELDASLSVSSSDFIQSFSFTGAKAGVGIKFGF